MEIKVGTILRHNLITVILTAVSVALLIGSFFAPPFGEINSSVLKGVACLFGFAALWTFIIAMYRGSDVAFIHKDTQIKINNDRENEAGN